MKRTITIQLKTPLKAPQGDVNEIVLREPNVIQCIRLGDPFVVGTSRDGSQLVVENPEVIESYLNNCLVEPRDPAILLQGGVEVARQIKDAIFSFFLQGNEGGAASETLPTSSRSEDSAAA
jgi:hypothetical protein